jgi:hypothetical protein
MPWADEIQVKTALAANLKREVASLPPTIDEIVFAAVRRARQQFRDKAYPLGYSEEQLVGWESLWPLHRHQCLYWAELELFEVFKETIGELHRRKECLDEFVATLQETLDPETPPTGDDLGVGQGVGAGLMRARREFDEARARLDRPGAPWGR